MQAHHVSHSFTLQQIKTILVAEGAEGFITQDCQQRVWYLCKPNDVIRVYYIYVEMYIYKLSTWIIILVPIYLFCLLFIIIVV